MAVSYCPLARYCLQQAPRSQLAGASHTGISQSAAGNAVSDTEDEEALLQWHPADPAPHPRAKPLARNRPKSKPRSSARQQVQPRPKAEAALQAGLEPGHTVVSVTQSGVRCVSGPVSSTADQNARQHTAVRAIVTIPQPERPPSHSQTSLRKPATVRRKSKPLHNTRLPPDASATLSQAESAEQSQQQSPPVSAAPPSLHAVALPHSATDLRQPQQMPVTGVALPSVTASWDSSAYSSCADYAASFTSDSTTTAAASGSLTDRPAVPSWPMPAAGLPGSLTDRSGEPMWPVANAAAAASGGLTDRSDMSIWPLADATALTGRELHDRLQKLEAEISFSSLISSLPPAAGGDPASWMASAAAAVGGVSGPMTNAASAGIPARASGLPYEESFSLSVNSGQADQEAMYLRYV